MEAFLVLASSLLLAGCPHYVAVQCIEDTDCDLGPGGVCATGMSVAPGRARRLRATYEPGVGGSRSFVTHVSMN